MSMTKRISDICKIASRNLSIIRKIRKFLDVDSTKIIVHALVMSHLDYCNSLLFGLPKSSLARLQCIQNTAARLILKLDNYSSIANALKTLHWLPINTRIEFKILVTTYNALYNTGPSYISNLLSRRNSHYSLRSHNSIQLAVPRSRCKTFGDRAFAVAAPKLWNSLPPNVKLADNVKIFKSRLKTLLFHRYYS